MNTIDQTFFAAYGQPIATVNESSHTEREAQPTPSKGSRRRNVLPQDAQEVDSGWYRVDQQHRDKPGAPPPHTNRKDEHRKASTESVSVEFGSWSSSDIWQSSCLVMGASMPPIDTSVPEVSETKSPAKKSAKSPPKSPPKKTVPPVEVSIEHEEPEVPETEPVVDHPATVPMYFTAQWEVDEFAWPEELVRLQTEQAEYFRYAGEKLRDACQEGLKTLAVVATREKEGCTTMAICLARAAAAAGARVALLDTNLAHPELGPRLGLDFSHGWQESLNTKSELSEAAVLAIDSGLTLLPLSANHELDSLTDPRVSAILRQLGADFDLLIIDAGVTPDDVAMFEGNGDCPVNAALVVRDLRRTSEAETLATAAKLKSLGIEAIGIAENFTPSPGSQVAAA